MPVVASSESVGNDVEESTATVLASSWPSVVAGKPSPVTASAAIFSSLTPLDELVVAVSGNVADGSVVAESSAGGP